MPESNGVHGYYPEMGHAKPNCQIEAKLCHYGKHYFLKTPLVLKGRGVEHTNTLKPSDLIPQAQHKVGWHEYRVTLKAYAKIKAEHSVSYQMLLD